MRDGRKKERPLKLGSRLRLRKLRYDLMQVVVFSDLCSVPEPFQTRCTQNPDDQHRECIEDNRVELRTTVYEPRYRRRWTGVLCTFTWSCRARGCVGIP